jgi:hypothetical protein
MLTHLNAKLLITFLNESHMRVRRELCFVTHVMVAVSTKGSNMASSHMAPSI